MTTFLQISAIDARYASIDNTLIYTPCYNGSLFYLYKDEYSPEEQPFTIDLEDTYLDGLTPINPSKPMFPRKS